MSSNDKAVALPTRLKHREYGKNRLEQERLAADYVLARLRDWV